MPEKQYFTICVAIDTTDFVVYFCGVHLFNTYVFILKSNRKKCSSKSTSVKKKEKKHVKYDTKSLSHFPTVDVWKPLHDNSYHKVP